MPASHAPASTPPPESEQVIPYAYPEHLRNALQGMPAATGVYIFHAEGDNLPLYIGKSVNLRARLLSHLRNPQEARMLRQATHISHNRYMLRFDVTAEKGTVARVKPVDRNAYVMPIDRFHCGACPNFCVNGSDFN